MAVEVAKVELKSVQDASGLEERILAGQFTADEVVAVVGKTEGNGGVNDFTRLLADHAFRRVLLKHGKRGEAEVATVPMVWSGGCDGVITPHATVFARNDRKGSADKSRLVIGTAMSAELQPEDIGRLRMVEVVAEGVKAAMKDAGIEDSKDVHYVQTKTPLLTIEWVENAKRRGKTVACEVHDSMGVSNGTTGLGIAVALGEIPMPRAEQICKDLDLYSSVASCSSGVELTRAQIVLMGNKASAGGRYRIGHSVMKDALDLDGIYAAIRNAGLELPDRPRAEDLKGRLVNCFIKSEADHRGKLRGRRQIMLDDSDVHHHRHSKAAVGGVAAAAIGDPAVFVSVDAMHQGPHGQTQGDAADCIHPYRWQATTPPPSSRGCKVGSTSEHTDIAAGHRGWNRHPEGRRRALGTSPAMVRSGCGSSGWDGSAAAKRALVYGCIGRAHRVSLSADSTILPRYITAIRWLMCATVARSWPRKR
jgi:cyanuric acid amidohydrolase